MWIITWLQWLKMDHLVYIFILTWIIHQYITSKKEIFSVCLQASACCSPSCHYVCVYVCVCDHVYTNSQCCMASLWGTSKSLITDFSISFKANQSVKSLSSSNICMIRLGQECLWSHCATLPVISPSLSRVYFWLLYAPRRRKKKEAKIILHCTFSATPQIKARTPCMSLCPRSPKEMRNLCVPHSPSL